MYLGLVLSMIGLGFGLLLVGIGISCFWSSYWLVWIIVLVDLGLILSRH